MIDLHSHVLPGVDDGAADLEESLSILESAGAEGVTAIAATPHVRQDYRTTPEKMERALAELRAAANGTGVEVLAGGELALHAAANLDDATLARFGLGGSRAILVESPYRGWPLELGNIVFDLQTRGFTVVLGHPERNPEVQDRPELLEPLVAQGALVQVTAGSVDGRMGSRAKKASKELFDRGLVHVLASDAHGPSVRAFGISGALDEIGDDELARWLTLEVPQAILDGERPPDRPERRRWRK